MGPLQGVRVIEMAGIGPGPYTGMMLADMGAEVIRVARFGGNKLSMVQDARLDISNRGKRCLALNLKDPRAIEIVFKLLEGADALLEGYRPGVMEKLGLGPQPCLARVPRLVYGRMTGWGQEGPLANAAGHDLNYIALTGALHAIGEKGQKPVVPLNLIGDFGGGGLLLAFGMACALFEASRSGKGQVVDAAMVDGASSLLTLIYSAFQGGAWRNARGENLLDGGAHFYGVYETADGKYVSIGSIEPQFYALLLEKLGLAGQALPAQMDHTQWEALKEKIGAIFRTRTREQWCEVMEGTDVCFAPVLDFSEITRHKHAVARKAYLEDNGAWQPAPAPRFSRTPPARPRDAVPVGANSDEILSGIGFDAGAIAELHANGVVA